MNTLTEHIVPMLLAMFALSTLVLLVLKTRSVIHRLRKAKRRMKESLAASEEISAEELKQEEELSDSYYQVFEHAIIGLSFYDAEGHLLNSNAEMRRICNFDSESSDTFFSSINLFDMAPFSECCDRKNVEELWICSHSVVPERGMSVFLEIRLHPVCDDNGRLIYISVAARDITQERLLYQQARENDAQIRRANEEIQQYESELCYLMESCHMRAWRTNFERREIYFYKGLNAMERTMTFSEFRRFFLKEDSLAEDDFNFAEEHFSKPQSFMRQMQPLFGNDEGLHWVQINSIPDYDEEGQLIGSFGILRNVTGMMQKQEQLKKETERANDSGRLKSVFLANMTHEIRTPLNAIVGFSDLLQSMDGEDEKRELIRIIRKNCDMLLRLIDDILSLSNLDANEMQLVPERIDAANEFDILCQSLTQRIELPGVTFISENPYRSLVTSIDNGRIQQVITNFVTNAIKYTHEGYIKLGYRIMNRDELATINGTTGASTQNGIYLYCEDTGSGIPEDKQASVFERFVKLNDYIQGTGLGLSICKAIVEKFDGEIGLMSEPGKGSTFWFWIPVEIEKVETKQ